MFCEICCAAVFILLFTIFVNYLLHIQRILSMPPGPIPLPCIGNLHMISNKPMHIVFTNLSEKYGTVFSISLGMERYVIINDIENATKTLSLKIFSGRPYNSHYLYMYSRGFTNVINADYSDDWNRRRKLAQNALRTISDENGDIESKLIRESQELHRRLRSKIGSLVSVRTELGICIANIICKVLFGYRYSLEEDEKEFQKLQEFNHILVNLSFDNDPINYVSWIKYIYHTKNFKKYLEGVNARDEFVGNQFAKHLQTFRDEKIRDYTDMLIKKKEIKSNFSEIDGRVRNEIEMILGDMLLAGTDTSRSMLEWSILYLLHWPHLQELIYNEIVDYVGKGKYPFLKDRQNLHICNAFISESLRYTSFSPILVPHKALENEMIGPYKIPKGTIIIFNAWKIHHDEKHWQDPFKFDHTRWLDENNKYKTNKSFAPFSLGVRSCPGESLSHKEIFVFLTRLVCDFKLLPEDNKPLPDLKGIANTTIVTEPYFIKVEERKY